jgi:putative ABC transport system substrate-binding protein
LLLQEEVALAMREKTTSIPIVLFGAIDPVRSGLAKSLARPGTNVTGYAQLNYQLPEKHIDLMREINPRLARVAQLVDLNHPACRLVEENAREAAGKVRATYVPYYVRSREEIERAFAQMERERPDMLLPCPSPVMLNAREFLIDNVLRLRIAYTSFVVASARKGVLFSYASDIHEGYRIAARYTDRILKGANPAEMPIEQPTQFRLVINLQTAEALNLTVPLAVLVRAESVID